MKVSKGRSAWCIIGLFAALILLLAALPASAEVSTSIASSEMIFEGTLTDNGNGTYSGVLPMVDETATGLGDLVGGYDVYAENGATAWFGDDPGTGPAWTSQAISGNDAWPTWTPDTPDWYQYSLELKLDGGQYKWALRNHPGATAGTPWSVGGNPAAGVPMSGTMYWANLYAEETDVGAYLSGTGTPEIPGGAASKGGGAQAWDMDWSWGSEMVPLKYPGFHVTVTSVGGGAYRVIMTPAPPPLPPSEVWVDDGYDAVSCAAAGHSWQYDCFATIQDGIDNVTNSTVHVGPGTYSENVVITKAVTLNGAQAGVDARGRVSGSPNPAIESIITASNGILVELKNGSAASVIDGFSLVGGGNGIRSNGGPLDDLVVRNNHMAGMSSSAVFLNDSGDDVTFHQNVLDGTGVTGGGGFLHLDQDTFDGFHLTSNWLINQNNGTGFFVDGTRNVGSSTTRSPLFDDNLVKDNDTGMNVGRFALEDATISGNTFESNNYDGFQGGPKDSTISGNTFKDNGRYGLALTGFGGSADPSRGAQSCTVSGNSFSGNVTADVVFSSSQYPGTISTNVLHYNSLTSSVGLTYAGSEVIDAEKNWWGDATGPAHGDNPHGGGAGGAAISGSADFVPWLATSTTTSATEYVSVTHNPVIAVSDTIQGAIAAALSGDTITVSAGTYVETGQIVINKDLTIAGADKTTTIVKPAQDTGSSGDPRGWWLVQSGSDLDLSAVTLDGQGKNIYQAIRSWGSGTIDDSVIKNITYPGYMGVGVVLYDNMTVSDCSFSNMGRIGVIAFGTSSTSSVITGNTYTGKGSGDWLDYAVEVGGGAQATISDNIITDNVGVASSDGSTSAGILVTTYYGAGTTATITGNDISDCTTGVAVGYDSSDTSTVTAHDNCIYDNDEGMDATGPSVSIDAEENWWGDASGPYHPTKNAAGTGNEVSDYVDFEPWITDGCGGSSTTGSWQNTRTGEYNDLQDLLDSALDGDEIKYMGSGIGSGGATANTGGVTINLNGGTVGGGSPFLTVNAPDITVIGPGTIDGDPTDSGTNSTDPGILVQAAGDNLIVENVEIKRWADGIELAGDVTSFKVVGNWVHSNTDAGLQVNSGISLGGVVTIEGNLFKVNGGNGIQNDGATDPLPAEYNSWGDLDGPTDTGDTGDGVSTKVDYEPFTFAEIFLDMEPDTEAIQRTVTENDTFDVKLKADSEKLYGLSFEFTWDTTLLTLNSTTFSAPWDGDACMSLSSTAGTIAYVCNLELPTTEWDADGGTIATFNFTADLPGIGSTEDGPWTAVFDISDDEAKTRSGAVGGIKVFLNNAGYNDPSDPDRDITDTNDGQVDINGLANYTGFIDLQGRSNDSGGTLTVYDQQAKSGSTALADGTSASSGSYTTAYLSTHQLVVGTTYWFQVDRPLYLPTTAMNSTFTYPTIPSDWQQSKLLSTRPLTALGSTLLLGGDATDDDRVDVSDATCIGNDYSNASSTCSTGNSDVNEDGIIDLLDLVLMGGNYDRTFSTWTP